MIRDNKYLKGNQFAKGNKPNKTSFQDGSIPWNKGKKGIRLSKKTEFKKGNKPYNRKPVGTITQRPDVNGTVRNFIKIKEPKEWMHYTVYVWIKSGRKIKKGYCVHHINFNPLDDRIENLCMVSRKDHPKLHKKKKEFTNQKAKLIR